MSMDSLLEKAFPHFKRHQKTFFLILTILLGVSILLPYHNFQYFISEGDHGRDLYCFKKTMEGALPYRDYSWVLGVFMPYYYALFFKMFGVSIQSALLGQNLLAFLVGFLTYLITSRFLTPWLSFLCAFSYWAFRGSEFFYTYVHIGGIVCLLGALLCLIRYVEKPKLSYALYGFAFLFLLHLIRLNMGFMILTAYVILLYIIDFIKKDSPLKSKSYIYLLVALFIWTIVSSIYGAIIRQMPDYAIPQSFPYFKTYRTESPSTLLTTLMYTLRLTYLNFTSTWPRRLLVILLILLMLRSMVIYRRTKDDPRFQGLFLSLAVIIAIMVVTTHEFFASMVFYRIFWVLPVFNIFVFYLFHIGLMDLSKSIRYLLIITLCLAAYFHSRSQIILVESYKNPYHLLHIGKNKVYSMQDPFWIMTIRDTVKYIKQHIPPSDKILVLPHAPLYLFLSERDSAAWELIFFEHINIPREQEQKIIAEMETGGATWVLITNQSVLPAPGMGIFGKTYCPLLAQYIYDHFTVVAEFGDWVNPPGWAWNHGVRILKRIK